MKNTGVGKGNCFCKAMGKPLCTAKDRKYKECYSLFPCLPAVYLKVEIESESENIVADVWPLVAVDHKDDDNIPLLRVLSLLK